MAEPATPQGGRRSGRTANLEPWLARAVKVEPHEIAALLVSFAFFFCVLCSYYILRPIRDEMGIALGRDNLQYFLVVILFVMLAAVPAFGWVVTRFARARIVPVVYGFLIANLLAFWAVFPAGSAAAPGWLAGTFFVWINVYVLFAVSLFWSFMSDIWESGQAKRLYGFISVGGTAGALTGPLLLNLLITPLGLANLLLVSAAFLLMALALSQVLRRVLDGRSGASVPPSEHGSLIAGALNVWRSPYLFRIALWVLAANLIGMYFYLKQNEIVGALIDDREQRVLLFSRIDLATNTLTILAQAFAVGRLIERIGVGRTAAILPAWCVVGTLLLAVAPALWSIAMVVVVQRAFAYGFGNPSMRTLYTVVDARDKYRSQNFIDTFVYRGGEAGAGWLFNSLGKLAGAGGPVVLAIGVAATWIWLSFDLGRRQEKRVTEREQPADGQVTGALHP